MSEGWKRPERRSERPREARLLRAVAANAIAARSARYGGKEGRDRGSGLQPRPVSGEMLVVGSLLFSDEFRIFSAFLFIIIIQYYQLCLCVATDYYSDAESGNDHK